MSRPRVINADNLYSIHRHYSKDFPGVFTQYSRPSIFDGVPFAEIEKWDQENMPGIVEIFKVELATAEKAGTVPVWHWNKVQTRIRQSTFRDKQFSDTGVWDAFDLPRETAEDWDNYHKEHDEADRKWRTVKAKERWRIYASRKTPSNFFTTNNLYDLSIGGEEVRELFYAQFLKSLNGASEEELDKLVKKQADNHYTTWICNLSPKVCLHRERYFTHGF